MLNFKPMPLIKTALRYVADVGAFVFRPATIVEN